MLTCRCPACDEKLTHEGRLTEDTWISCVQCDRGFHPGDAICVSCRHRNPFVHDGVRFTCQGCGASQPDYAARRTA